MHRIYFESYSFALSCLYLLLTIVVFFQISRILYYKHNLRGFQFGFLSLCGLWGILRFIFWLLTPLDPLPELILQETSINIQFATFTYLALFYVQIVYKENWDEVKNKAIGLYFAGNIFFLIVIVVHIVLAVTKFRPDTAPMEIAELVIATAEFLVLVIVLGVYSAKLFFFTDAIHKVTMPLLRKSKDRVAVLSVLLCLLFFSRAVRDAIAAVGLGNLYFKLPESQSTWEQVLLFTLYFAWELVPVTFVVALFWHIPATNQTGNDISVFAQKYGATDSTTPYTPYYQSNSSINNSGSGGDTSDIVDANRTSRIFSDERRYDSDEETEGLLGGPSTNGNEKQPIASKGSSIENQKIPTNKNSKKDSLSAASSTGNTNRGRFGSAGTRDGGQPHQFVGFVSYNTNSPFNKTDK